MILYYLLLAPCLSLWYFTIFYRPTAFHYGTHLPSTGPLLIFMVLYYLLLAPCLFLWYTTFFYWLTTYPYGTLLSSTDLLPISTVLYYHLLTPCLSLSYFTTFYCPTTYTFGTLLSSTGSLPIPIVVYCLQWPTAYAMLLFYLLVIHCLYLWHSTIFYRLPYYPCDTLLSSTGPLPIPMVIYCLLLALCL